ncbi:MAG: hypothetical protein K2W95_00580 [Candidatus Obscuribacterales bacterium]|nr:hypothetical protein [Candidatus Obscuribacterales bacterium]
MRKLVVATGVLMAIASAVCTASYSAPLAPAAPAPASVEELRAEKVKRLIKRDARAQDLMPKVEAKLAALAKESPNSPLLARLKAAVDAIVMSAGTMSDVRTRADVDLLEAFVRDHKSPSAEELAPLQERYKKICGQFDDLVLVKDLDRAFKIHDKLVRYTSLDLWDKDKITAEIERLEDLIANAPDIAYGSSELLSTYKNKKLASVPRLVYLGSFPNEEIYLTPERRSEGLIESAGGTVQLETVDHLIQNEDGSLVDVTAPCNPARGIPFSPPLSLWSKCRILAAKVPAITFRLPERSFPSAYVVKDVVDGKLDDYIRTNMIALGAPRLPVLVGFLSEFDRDAAALSFGDDGKTPYYTLMDPKLKDLSGDKLADELRKRIGKGVFATAKTVPADLCNKYGEPDVPDGPERVRDAWKRFHKIMAASGGETLAFYSSAGSFHGNKNAARLGLDSAIGNQAWNKLDYYWPGESVFDWIGINAVGTDPGTDPKGATIMEAIEPFMAEVRTSNFQSTPVMLRGLAPSSARTPLSEGPWIGTVFGKIIPATFPNIGLVFVNIPNNLTLWSGDSISAYRTGVASNKNYKWPLRFKTFTPASVPQQAGGNP